VLDAEHNLLDKGLGRWLALGRHGNAERRAVAAASGSGDRRTTAYLDTILMANVADLRGHDRDTIEMEGVADLSGHPTNVDRRRPFMPRPRWRMSPWLKHPTTL
jgi:hypothetical protein